MTHSVKPLDSKSVHHSNQLDHCLTCSDLDNAVHHLFMMMIITCHQYTQMQKTLSEMHKMLQPIQVNTLAGTYRTTPLQILCATVKTVAPLFLLATSSPALAKVASSMLGKGAEGVAGLLSTSQQGSTSSATQDLEATSRHLQSHSQAEQQAQQLHDRMVQQSTNNIDQSTASKKQITT